MVLANLQKNQSAKIIALPNDLDIASQLMEQGFYPNANISLAHKAPFNGPLAFFLHGTKVSIQQHLAAQIEVEFLQ